MSTTTSDRPVKIPGPDHPITITPHTGRVTVSVGGQTIADTTRALKLQEASYPAAFYIPREDADMALLDATDHATYCPYKGECSYHSIPSGGDKTRNAVWSYQQPYDSVKEIAGHLAFYPDRVDIISL